MREAVTLSQHKTRKANGKVYTYWVIRWHGSDGKHHGKTLGSTEKISKRQAEKLRQQKETELAKQPGRRNVSRVPLLGEYLNNYLKDRQSELAPGTLALHGQTIRYLKAFFGEGRRLDTIQRTDARAFRTALANGDLTHINKRQQKMGVSTVDMNIRNARKMFGRALDDDLILLNPFDRLTQSAPVVKDWHYVDVEEFEKLMTAASPPWRLLLGLARWAGLRRGEALHLRWEQIDWDQARLTVVGNDEWQPKDRETRTVPIARRLYRLLLDAFGAAEEGQDTVIPAETVVVKNISRDFEVLCRRAGVTRYNKPLHTLRKSCLTDWAAEFSVHAVKEWAGHSSIETTDAFYLKVGEAEYRRAAGLSENPNADVAQLVAQLGDSEQKSDKSEKEDLPEEEGKPAVTRKAGDRIRTDDVQLGNVQCRTLTPAV